MCMPLPFIAEKYLKALLVWHQIEFKKIHDIAVLLRLASKANPETMKAKAPSPV